MFHFDSTVTVGNLLTLGALIGTLLGIWLRTEKLVAILSYRVSHVETRLNGHDEDIRDEAAWRLDHVANPHKSAPTPRPN